MTNATETERQEIGGLQDVIRPKWPNPVSFNEDNPDGDPFTYNEGEPFEMTITDGRPYHARDFDTKEPMFWDAEKTRPLMILVLIGVDAKTGEECSHFIQGKELTTAFNNALAEAKVSGIAGGDTIRTTWTGSHKTEPKKGATRAKLSPTKEYACVLTPGS